MLSEEQKTESNEKHLTRAKQSQSEDRLGLILIGVESKTGIAATLCECAIKLSK